MESSRRYSGASRWKGERIPDPESALCANRLSAEKSAGGEEGIEILCRYRLSNDGLNRDGSSYLRVTFRSDKPRDE